MIRGECLCGALAFEISGKTSPVWLCHCSKCRRSTGSAFHPAVMCRPEVFRWLRGGDGAGITEYASESGYTVRFCSRCGSFAPLVDEAEGRVVLSAGMLDEGFERHIALQIFAGSKARWWPLDETLETHEEHRPTPRG